MVKTIEDFLFSLDYFMLEYGEKMPQEYLEKNRLNNVSEIPIIIRNAIDAKKENGLTRLKNVRDYFIECLEYYRNIYGFDAGFESQEEIEFVLSDLISDLEPRNFTKIAQIISPPQIMNIKGLSRRKKIPEDIEREISSFVGKRPFGGYRKKGTMKKMATRKNTHRTKNRTNRMKKHKHKRIYK
jgi:hypothetical protein